MQETNGPDAYFLGPEQVTWLKRELLNSRATWKVIANDMPLALIRIYDPDRNWGYDAIAQGDNGPPRGREGTCRLLSPSSNAEKSTIPCGSRPTCITLPLTTSIQTRLHFRTSILFGNSFQGLSMLELGFQNQIDKTFGPQVVYAKARLRDLSFSGAPSEGLQFFGVTLKFDGMSEVMTVTLKDADDHALWSARLEPKTT